MNERYQQFKHWWAARDEREQRILTVGAVVVVAAFFYAIIWSPYLTRVETLRKQIQTQQKTLNWMKGADTEIRQLEAGNTPKAEALSPVELLSYLQKQLEISGLGATQLKQTANDSVQLQFQKVDFDRMIAFLVKVAKEQSVVIIQMSVIADATPGVVNADILLKLS